MIEFTATDPDGSTMTIYSGSYPSPTDNTDYSLGTRNRIEVTSPDGDRLCCDLTPTSQARLAATLTGTNDREPDE